MKKALFIAVLLMLGIAILPAVSMAENLESIVVHSVSTFTVSGDDYNWNANPLVISSTAKKSLIKELDISVDVTNATQIVTLWDGWSLNTSSANVARIWEIRIPSNTTSTSGANVVYSKTFRYGDRGFLKADYGLAVTKSSTIGNVTVSIQYK